MSDTPQKGNGTPDYWAGVRHGRMMTRIDSCVCAFDEDGNGPLNVCGAHQEWADAMIKGERAACASKAREYAAHYPSGSDGRNTLIMLAEWIENRAKAQS
jgi:hypothetical protein